MYVKIQYLLFYFILLQFSLIIWLILRGTNHVQVDRHVPHPRGYYVIALSNNNSSTYFLVVPEF